MQIGNSCGGFAVYRRIMPLIMQSAHYFLFLINLFGFLTLSLFAVSSSWKQNKKKKNSPRQSWRADRSQHMGELAVGVWEREDLPESWNPLQSQPFSPADSFMYPNLSLSSFLCFFFLYLLSLNLTGNDPTIWPLYYDSETPTETHVIT